jgi:hypothetical protein
MCGGLLAAIFLIVWGALMLFNKDFMWEMADWNHRRQGLTGSERTPEWEFNMTLGGIAALGLGILVLLVILLS